MSDFLDAYKLALDAIRIASEATAMALESSRMAAECRISAIGVYDRVMAEARPHIAIAELNVALARRAYTEFLGLGLRQPVSVN